MFVPDGVTFTIVRADAESYCLTAQVDATGATFSYRRARRAVEAGNTC